MFQILAPLNLKELWYLVVLVLSSGGRLQEVKNNAKTIKPSGQKLVAVAYERPSFTRGCNHRILTGKIFVFG